jgi:transcriptional regulator with XRE-family HTH domain
MAEALVSPSPSSIRIEGLRTFRQLAGLTQRELARRVGVNPSTISELERGTMSPRLTTARRLLQVLRAPSVEALFPDPPLATNGRRRAPKTRSSKG